MSIKVIDAVLESGLPCVQRMVMVALGDWADDAGHGDFLGQPMRYLAQKAGISERTAFRVVRQLVTDEWIVVHKRYRGRAVRYRINGELRADFNGRKSFIFTRGTPANLSGVPCQPVRGTPANLSGVPLPTCQGSNKENPSLIRQRQEAAPPPLSKPGGTDGERTEPQPSRRLTRAERTRATLDRALRDAGVAGGLGPLAGPL